MREYSFDRIPFVRRREGLSLERDYREVILDRAQSGWEFVQAVTFDEHARPHLDLVFTREDKQ